MCCNRLFLATYDQIGVEIRGISHQSWTPDPEKDARSCYHLCIFKTWGCLSSRNPPNILKSVEIGQQTTSVFFLPLPWRKPVFQVCHSKEDQQQFQGVKSYINSPNNAAWKNNNNPPPHPRQQWSPPSLYLGDLTFCIKFDPWKTGKPQPIHSIWGSNDHGQRKKEPEKNMASMGNISLIFFWLINLYKKKVNIMLLWRVFLIYTMVVYLFQRFLPSKTWAGFSNFDTTQFPSFFFWNFNQF